MKKKKTVRKKFQWFSPEVNQILFSMLLVATPFLMLQNYLQQSVHALSESSINIFGLNVPYVLLIVILLFILPLTILFKKLTLKRLLALIIVLIMMAIGQNTSDYYINYKFYDLQNNWHYIAYGLYVFIIYRVLKPKNATPLKIMTQAFVHALAISAFDEGIQVFISNRIFDLSDIAKDMWGVMMGLIILFFVVRQGDIVKDGWKIRTRYIKDYIKQPFSVLIFEIVLAYIFVFVASILAGIDYWYMVFILTISIFLLVFFIVHLSQFKLYRRILTAVGIVAIILQSIMIIKYHDDNIVHNSYGITIYKGIPIPYFDVMIYQSGLFRLVDKKHGFKGGDIKTFFNQKADILLIGSGAEGEGGMGFPGTKFAEFKYFIFNTVNQKGMQIIILKTTDACREFNRMKKEGLNVLFVLHNT